MHIPVEARNFPRGIASDVDSSADILDGERKRSGARDLDDLPYGHVQVSHNQLSLHTNQLLIRDRQCRLVDWKTGRGCYREITTIHSPCVRGRHVRVESLAEGYVPCQAAYGSVSSLLPRRTADADGRCLTLLPPPGSADATEKSTLKEGAMYKIVFKTKEYFASTDRKSFYPWVEISAVRSCAPTERLADYIRDREPHGALPCAPSHQHVLLHNLPWKLDDRRPMEGTLCPPETLPVGRGQEKCIRQQHVRCNG